MSWKEVPLGELIKESRIPAENPNPLRRIRVRLNVQGVEKRPPENEIEGATKQFIRKAGQFIYGKQNFHKGAFGVVPPELDGFETSADIPAFDVREDCKPEWLYYFFKIGDRYLELEKLARGVGSKRIHPDQIAGISIPLPEPNEQTHVIERLKNLEQEVGLVKDELSHQTSLLTALRAALLREAMQGALVPQDPTDEPAAALLARIRAEKQQMIQEKKARTGRKQEAEVQKELLFDIPPSWGWCALDDVCYNITDGTHQTPSYTPTGRIFLSAQNVKPFRFMPEVHRFVSEAAYAEYIRNRKAEKGDLLVARVGAGIGETAVIDRDLDFCFYVSLALVQPFKRFINSDYLAYVLNSPYGVQYAKGNVSSKGGSAGNFNLGRLRSFLIPLPPLPEQHRIVARLDALLAGVDALAARVAEDKVRAEALLRAALREALTPTNSLTQS